MIMKGLHITYDEGRSCPVRLPYYIKAWGFKIAPKPHPYPNCLLITDKAHQVQDFVELLDNSGCKNIQIHTKNFAHYKELIDDPILKKLQIIINYRGIKHDVPGLTRTINGMY